MEEGKKGSVKGRRTVQMEGLGEERVVRRTVREMKERMVSSERTPTY